MRLSRKLIVLLVVVALIVEISITFAAPSDESDRSEPVDANAGDVDHLWEPNFEEPLPCTNQRGKALYGCP